MATYDGVNHAKSDDPKSSNILAPGTFGGKVHCFIDSYEALSTAEGSVLRMGPELPVGAMVIGVTLSFDALGTSVTLAVGDASSSGRYVAAAAAASAGTLTAMLVNGIEYQVTSTTNQILVTNAGAEMTGTIKIVVFYVCD